MQYTAHDKNCLEFFIEEKELQTMSMVDVADHSFLPASLFSRKLFGRSNNVSDLDKTLIFLTCSVHSATISWDQTKKLINKVLHHVCGHASYHDIMLLLDRNHIWTEDCGKYLSSIMERCAHCKVVQLPTGSRKVSL